VACCSLWQPVPPKSSLPKEACRLGGWLVGLLACWLAGWLLAGWLAGWLDGLLVCWLACEMGMGVRRMKLGGGRL